MNTFTESIWADCRPHTWKYALRGTPIVGVQVHATRSAQEGWTSKQDYGACKNWYRSPDNRTVNPRTGAVSAGFTHAIVGDGGKFCICLPDEYYPRWAAGHMDEGGLWSIEIAQSTNDMPYDPLDIERAEHEIAKKLKQYGLPAKYIPYMEGDNRQAPGVAFHDASRNGTILGKSDPGKMPPFNNRPLFVARIAARMNGIEVPDIGPAPQPGGTDVFKRLNGRASFFDGRTYAVSRDNFMALHVDFKQLPKDATRVELDLRIEASTTGELIVRDGDKQIAGALNRYNPQASIAVVPGPDGKVYFDVIGAPVKFTNVGILGYWL